MLKLIYGEKGSGKTKNIISLANESVNNDGLLIFITDTDRYMLEVDKKIRLINVADYDIRTEEAFIGYIKGLLSGNYDIKHIFIDGIHRFLDKEIINLTHTLKSIKEISKNSNIDFTLTASIKESNMPKF